MLSSLSFDTGRSSYWQNLRRGASDVRLGVPRRSLTVARLSTTAAKPVGSGKKANLGINHIDPWVAIRENRLMKKEIITVAGSPGSGKSSTAKALAQSLDFRHFSSGDLFRQLAAERGLSIEAMNISAEVQRDIDLKVDNLLEDMYRTGDRLVIDSRMAWRWMPGSFKVFLVLDPDTAAGRVYSNLRAEGRQSEEATSVEEARRSIDRRFASEQRRYQALYRVNPTDPLNFDLVVNTRQNGLKTVTAMVLAAYRAWRSGQDQP
jgi:CMP/dCMP kinase